MYYLLYVLSCVLDELNIVFLYGRERKKEKKKGEY